MVSYADFMTLLLAFFVVMYSVSQLDDEKYRVLSQTMEQAFNVPETAINPIAIGDPVTAVNPGIVTDAVESPEQQPTSGRVEQEEAKATTSEPQLPEEFRRISQQVQDRFQDLIRKELVSVQGNEEWLEIELKSSLLFASGEAEPGVDAPPIMEALADIVSGSGLPIRVEGFTDNQPIASARFPSNWELSSARAASIVKLLEEFGVDASRLAAVGYGENQPVSSNDDETGRAENRRVVLMISRAARLRPQIARAAPGAAPAGDAVEERQPGVVAVELEGGGVLFTSDPARAAPAAAPAATPAPATEGTPAPAPESPAPR